MDKDETNTETVEYLKARMEELRDLADRLGLPVIGAWLTSAIDRIPEGAGK
jgi:hypothetical protein